MDNNEKRHVFSEEEEKRMKARSAVRAREREEKQKQAEIKKEKQRILIKKVTTVSKIVLVVVVIVSLLFIAAGSLGNVTFNNIIDYVKDGFSNMEAGEGYPLDVGSGSVKDMLMFGETNVLVRDNEIDLLNKTAKETVNYAHSYSKPLALISGGRMLVCDRVTGRYMIVDRSETLHNEELQAEIFSATFGKNGRYAFSVNCDGASSIVSVFEYDFDKLFDFKCAEEYIIGLSFSPDGKHLAMIGIGSKDAYVYSKLYVMNIKKQEIISTFDFVGESLNNVFYSSNDTIIAVSENAYTVIRDNKEKEKINFGFNTISRFSPDDDGNFAIVLSKYGSIDSGTVALLNSKGKEIFSVELESKIECIDYDGNTLCVVDSDHVVSTFNKRGKLIGKTKLDSPAQDIAVSGKYCYALCFGTVIQLDIRTNLD